FISSDQFADPQQQQQLNNDGSSTSGFSSSCGTGTSNLVNIVTNPEQTSPSQTQVPYKKLSGSSPNIAGHLSIVSSTGNNIVDDNPSSSSRDPIWPSSFCPTTNNNNNNASSKTTTKVNMRQRNNHNEQQQQQPRMHPNLLKVKQAPTPPKRTSSFRDSTYQDKQPGDEDILKGAEQTMNDIEKVFENLSSIEKTMADFAAQQSVQLDDNSSTTYMYNSDTDQQQRNYNSTNTISSTSSTRSSLNNNAQLTTNKNTIQQQQMMISNTKSKSTRTKSSSKNKNSKLNFDRHLAAIDPYEQEQQHHQQQQQMINSKSNKKSDLDVKRAINRYGTIPKGTQINAYLDSLRPQNEMLDTNFQSNTDNFIINSPTSSTVDCLNLDIHHIRDSSDNILTLQHASAAIKSPQQNYPKITTFSKDANNSVSILEDISNNSNSNQSTVSKPNHQHFNFTRQKSDLTHSKTIENVNFNFKSSKARQLRNGNKNHLQLLKSVASPRLPLKSSANSDQIDCGNVDDLTMPVFHQITPLPPPPAIDDDLKSPSNPTPKILSKSESFDFVSFKPSMNPIDPLNNLMTLDEIINPEDFPPPPSTSDLNSGDFNNNDDDDDENISESQTQNEKQNTKVTKKSSKDKSSSINKQQNSPKDGRSTLNKMTTKRSNDTTTLSKIPIQNSAFINELNESFRLKTQKSTNQNNKDQTTTTTTAKVANTTKTASFLFKRSSKPEPSCPAPAIPIFSNFSQSKFYTKNSTNNNDSAMDVNNSNVAAAAAVDAEYVTPVLKKVPLKPFQSIRQQQESTTNEENHHHQTTSTATKPKSKASKLALFFNSGSNAKNQKHLSKPSEEQKTKSDKTINDNNNLDIMDPSSSMMSKSIISQSGYDADDDDEITKRHSGVSNYKKFWENHSSITATNNNNNNNTGGETSDSGIGSISKSNDSVISSSSSINSSTVTVSIQSKTNKNSSSNTAMSSPKLNTRGNSKLINNNKAISANMPDQTKSLLMAGKSQIPTRKSLMKNSNDSSNNNNNKMANNFNVVLKPVSDSTNTAKLKKSLASESIGNNNNDDDSTMIGSNRESIIECSKQIELMLDEQLKQNNNQHTMGKNLNVDNTINADTTSLSNISPSRMSNNLKRVCDIVLVFRKSCLSYAEHSLMPQQRFRFRELLTKLEKSNESLRGIGGGGINENSLEQLNELQSNLRDIVVFVQK
ncbi:hypothetical protein DERF_001736, partial [Dermatophagoides farinae]